MFSRFSRVFPASYLPECSYNYIKYSIKYFPDTRTSIYFKDGKLHVDDKPGPYSEENNGAFGHPTIEERKKRRIDRALRKFKELIESVDSLHYGVDKKGKHFIYIKIDNEMYDLGETFKFYSEIIDYGKKDET